MYQFFSQKNGVSYFSTFNVSLCSIGKQPSASAQVIKRKPLLILKNFRGELTKTFSEDYHQKKN